MYLVLLGVPGSGKGTQANVLAGKLGVAHVATGHLLREAVENGTELGKQADAYMERGELVPDDLVVAMVAERMARPDAERGAVLDGFPRNLYQGRSLDRTLSEQGARVDMAIFLDVSEPVLVGRIAKRLGCTTCGALYHYESHPPREPGICDRCGSGLSHRIDDRPETVRKRLQVYMEQTEPLLDYYRKQGVLVEVNGEAPVPEVTRQILSAVTERVG